MTGFAADGGVLSARFVFPEEFIGFQGHFPEKKILPGVCHIQCVLSLLEAHGKRPVLLREAVLVKFFHPVLPQEEILCTCRDVQDGNGEFTVKAVFVRGEQKVSELKLRVCYGEQGPGRR
jgi:3-hydroxyacyl-[acyl-carrier-protein] dehydratase